MNPAISIIIPTLDEAENLPAALAALRESTDAPPFEILVVDAGSSDGTTTLAREAGARVLETTHPSRAAQMNLGA
ncbi:MAG: glycosyltransferase, partial [Verrucomicrobiales bacterium]